MAKTWTRSEVQTYVKESLQSYGDKLGQLINDACLIPPAKPLPSGEQVQRLINEAIDVVCRAVDVSLDYDEAVIDSIEEAAAPPAAAEDAIILTARGGEKYQITFSGRKKGSALDGSRFVQTVEAGDINAAVLQLRETYDHVSVISWARLSPSVG